MYYHLNELLQGVAGALGVLQLGGQLLGLRLQLSHCLGARLRCALHLRQQHLQRRPIAPLLPQILLSLQQNKTFNAGN